MSNEIVCVVCGKLVGGGMYGSGIRMHARACERDTMLRNVTDNAIEAYLRLGLVALKGPGLATVVNDVLGVMHASGHDEIDEARVRREVRKQLRARAREARQ